MKPTKSVKGLRRKRYFAGKYKCKKEYLFAFTPPQDLVSGKYYEIWIIEAASQAKRKAK